MGPVTSSHPHAEPELRRGFGPIMRDGADVVVPWQTSGVGETAAMTTLLIEMPAGVAGDMLLAALLDLGGDRERLVADLAKLGLGPIAIEVAEVLTQGIRGRRVDVRVDQAHERWLYGAGPQPIAVDMGRAAGEKPEARGEKPEARGEKPEARSPKPEAPGDAHGHRPYRVIRELLARAPLPDRARARAQKAFALLAAAEGAVHGVAADDVEFHEVGSLDAIVDVIGCCLLLEQLGIERVVSGPFTPGEGQVRCAHGLMPVPVPAVAKMLADARAPQRRLGRETGELTTPTGCAIVLAITDAALGGRPDDAIIAHRVGYGAGHKQIDGIANAVRCTLIAERAVPSELVIELRCEIDDATGEHLAALIDDLLSAGAKDAYLTPIVMKKGRPGHLLTLLATADDAARLADRVLTRSTSIGIRASEAFRRILPRRTGSVPVRGHAIALKIVTLPDGSERAKPEADDVIAAARALGCSFVDVAHEALTAWRAGR